MKIDMVIRVQPSDSGKDRKWVSLKMGGQDWDIFLLMVGYLRAIAGPKVREETHIMEIFDKMVDDILEQDEFWRNDPPKATASDFDNDGDEEEDADKIKVQIDEFYGLDIFEPPRGKKYEDFISEEMKRLHRGKRYSLEDMLYVWLRDPTMRNKIKLVDGL